MTDQHPDFKLELDRLIFTKTYMDHLITSQEFGQEALKQRQEDVLEKLDFKDSSLRYQEMLTHASFMKMSRDQLEHLKQLRNKPYFARIDFHRKEKPDQEIFYIGKVSLFDRETQNPIILDWRSPLANVYYEGRLGDVSYEAHEGEVYEGSVSLKRQYQIEQGELQSFRDIDMTTKDELLQDSLSQTSENRLTEIVSTIQEEQNRVIRADLRKPIIVQGAAGSGKTTIALHRISYFLYTMREIFKPEEMLILAPNRLFIHYISEVLPELGVHKAKQFTFIDFVKHVTGLTWIVVTPQETLTDAIEQGNEELWMAEYKGSKAFKEVIDRYVQIVKKQYEVDQDFYLAGFRIKSGKAIKRLFVEEYDYFPYEVRVQKIKAVLQSEVRRKKKQILSSLAAKYDEELDHALFGMKDPEKRKVRVSYLITRKEERLKEVKKEARTAVAKYMKQYPKFKLVQLYRDLFTEENFRQAALHDANRLKPLKKKTEEYLRRKQLQAEDLAPLLYMKSYLSGLHKDDQMKKIVIDEAQDYSYFEIFSLRRAFRTDLFTIVGDLAQGIYRYRGLKDWDTLMKDVFPKATYLTLQKTYRTTIEIMDAANQLLALMPEQLPKAEPVVRHGEKPIFAPLTQTWTKYVGEVVQELKGQNMASFAVITKTWKEAELAASTLAEAGLPFQLMDEEQGMGDCMVLPAYLAKGLEFDVVFLYCKEHAYQLNEMDIKMLYVAMTRPLHRLFLIGENRETFLLSKIASALYKEASLDV
ncbi:AAA family ATPase [Halobacillus salinarum]|uniref:AAA family ATPase n=1 Tax=Halobacillus salinarum TaxID=2932257 RepID=A0ABY4ENB3_9BACI|nr:RNA polymerase recycling motor HelD [Halobacillus salinarum]UOQ43601.1 AAA family ATPase [Halobacillus salinarum]